MKRPTVTTRAHQAGCFVCHGSEARWIGANARPLAARHHDRTKHETWYDLSMAVRYGAAEPDPRQMDIEAAIAADQQRGSQA